MNKVMMIGRMCKDADIKQTTNGNVFCNVRIAIDNGKDNPATFVNCTAWKTTAENLAKYFHKGDKIGITGALKSRQWEDNNGNKRETLEVFIDSFDFCESKSAGGQAPAPVEAPAKAESLPFEI